MAVVTVDGAELHPAMCRLCLQSGPETSTVSIFSVANGFVVAQMAQDCLGIEIVKDGSAYENVCSPCIVSLVSMYELYLKYHECNRVFLQLLQASLEHAVCSPVDLQLEDLIEEDYSIDEESVEIVSVDEPDADSNASVGQVFEDSVYYMQDFGVYVRSAGEIDGLPNGPSVEETEWAAPVQQVTGTLMDELNAQVARLDGQEMANTSPTQEIISSHPALNDKPVVTVVTAETFCGLQPQPPRVHQDQERDQTFQEPKHHCFICETSFQNDIELVNHFPAHFLDVPQDCNLCGTHYRTVMNLNRHLAYHQPGRPYKCNLCERRFSDSQAFERHTAEFHYAQQRHAVAVADDAEQHLLVCDICGKMYVLAEPYEQHVRLHEHGQQQHQCKLCERSFPRNIYLLFHLETHARIRPHRCRYCSIPFASLYLKNFHEKRHPPEGSDVPGLMNGEREARVQAVVSRRCPLCLTTCRTKQRLLAHIETFHPADTRIQLLQCSFRDCRLRFLDLGEFQSHITDHHVDDRFPCTHCARVFKRQRLLTTHLTTAHGIEGLDATVASRPRCSFRCVSCAKTFRTDRTYQLHLVTVHSQNEPGMNDS
ncbi:zinc finger protein 778-like [Anopheles darlingi]|uniref:zinc finger protein 778-like n=1 Tax=Anopheles darlingi TaxID=43151 RepID=UPI002100598D|nr:zinc finger protein 778-like [Anopheles darlingi]